MAIELALAQERRALLADNPPIEKNSFAGEIRRLNGPALAKAADKAKPEAGRLRAFVKLLDEGLEMIHFLSSCSVIIHQTINAKNVYITVDGLTLALIVLVAVVGLAALFFTVRAFSR